MRTVRWEDDPTPAHSPQQHLQMPTARSHAHSQARRRPDLSSLSSTAPPNTYSTITCTQSGEKTTWPQLTLFNSTSNYLHPSQADQLYIKWKECELVKCHEWTGYSMYWDHVPVQCLWLIWRFCFRKSLSKNLRMWHIHALAHVFTCESQLSKTERVLLPKVVTGQSETHERSFTVVILSIITESRILD